MRCEEFLNQWNARVDGELTPDAGAALDAHLAECSQCKAAAEGLQTVDGELRRALAPRRNAAARLAENVAAQLRAEQIAPLTVAAAPVAAGTGEPMTLAPRVAPSQRIAWGQTLLGLAAGFLLAVALFRPWQPRAAELAQAPLPTIAPAIPTPTGPTPTGPTPTGPKIETIAHMAATSGPVEVREPNFIEFFRCPEATPIRQDSIIRTGPTARCEIALEDGNAVRLDCNTEVTLRKSEVVEVNRGRLWSCSPAGGRGFEIQSGGGVFVANDAAQVTVDCQPQGVRLIVVDGAVKARAGQESQEVGPGQLVRISQGKMENGPEACDALLETSWVNNVLALRSAEDPELVYRVNRLLANVGAAKLSLLYEDELRRLGDSGVPPLLAYLEATRATPSLPERATAARIVADVAQSRWIADMITLLTDRNSDVRFQAARGLERLTGRDQGCDARAWQSESWAACEGAHQKWLKWWSANRDRYPAARREISAPASPPF